MISLLDQLFIYEMGIHNARKYCARQFKKECKKLCL